MPIYEYACKNCHHQFDVIQKMSESPVTLCPNCAEQSVVRLISAAGFQLKGSGWYQTDFKNKPTKPTDNATPSKPETTTATTTDSKTTLKTDSTK